MGAIKINGATSGSTTITAPATGGDESIELSTALASKLDLAGGKILQVVRATNAATFTTTSTTYVDVTGMSVTITPQRSDSAIIVIATARCSTNSGTGGDQRGNLAIADSSNNNLSGANLASFGNYNYSFSSPGIVSISMTVIGYDTPATTAATTYKMRLSSNVSTTTSSVTSGSQPAQMYAIEVSA